MIDIAICGACGRMGQKIIKTAYERDDMRIVAAVDRPNVPQAGEDIGKMVGIEEIGVELAGSERLEEVLKESKPDVLIDFTIAKAATKNVQTSAKVGVPVVVGTTGFSKEQEEEMEKQFRRVRSRL